MPDHDHDVRHDLAEPAAKPAVADHGPQRPQLGAGITQDMLDRMMGTKSQPAAPDTRPADPNAPRAQLGAGISQDMLDRMIDKHRKTGSRDVPLFDQLADGRTVAGPTAANGKSVSKLDADEITERGLPSLDGRAPMQGPGPTGDEYVDHGSYRGSDSFLTEKQRERLDEQFANRCQDAATQFQNAVGNLRVDTLLEKDDEDLPWFALLLVDIGFGVALASITRSVLSLKSNSAKSVARLFDAAVLQQQPDPSLTLFQRMQHSFSRLSDEHVKIVVNTVASTGKKSALAAVPANAKIEGKNEKGERLSYLAQLQTTTAIAFARFREQAPARATDAELVMLFDAMAIEHHSVTRYMTAIQEKIERFKKAKVTKIGRRYEERKDFQGDKPIGTGAFTPMVIRDVWVQWQTYESGHPKELVYGHEDRRFNPSLIRPDYPGNAQLPMQRVNSDNFDGPSKGVSNDPRALYSVPQEFWEAALLRHELMWGAPPTTVHVDDEAYYWDPQRSQRARANKTKRSTQ
jgi:hypothetical protein